MHLYDVIITYNCQEIRFVLLIFRAEQSKFFMEVFHIIVLRIALRSIIFHFQNSTKCETLPSIWSSP